MLNRTIAEDLSNFVYNLQYKDLPENVIRKGKLSILDNLGVIIGAWKEKNVLIILEVIRQYGGNPNSTILVYNDKVSIFQAAFCHGIMGHSLELDDHISHKHSLNHPGVVSVPPALALGEYRNIDG